MKVLHLPTNIASQTSITVRALRDLGVEARGLVWNQRFFGDREAIEYHEPVSLRKHPIRRMARTAKWWSVVGAAMRWADVIHWHFSASTLPWNLDLRYAARLGKARLVEFWGTDIRIPEIAAADNPFLAKMYREYPEEVGRRAEASRRIQRRFARFGFECLLPGVVLEPYIDADLFPVTYASKSRVILSDFEPRYPDPRQTVPLVVHSSSHKTRKGTDAVLRAVEELRKTYRFEFKLIHGVTRREAMQYVRRCDVFLDQFVFGAYGVAAVEAMALGKPVVGYIKPTLAARCPADLPIVNATPENLGEVLEKLLASGRLRHETGRASRAFVEKHHDAHKIARNLVNIYEELLRKHHADS